MNIEELLEYCVSKPHASDELPFGPDILVMKVGGKAFLLTPLDTRPVQFNVKCDPERAIELRERYDWIKPGYHMNKKHWNTVVAVEGADERLLRELIDHSYELVIGGLPKKEREKLLGKKA